MTKRFNPNFAYSAAIMEGYTAYYDGDSKDSCPYPGWKAGTSPMTSTRNEMPWIDQADIDACYLTDWPDLVQEIKRLLPQLSDKEVQTVATIVVETCSYCHAASKPCWCSCDE